MFSIVLCYYTETPGGKQRALLPLLMIRLIRLWGYSVKRRHASGSLRDLRWRYRSE